MVDVSFERLKRLVPLIGVLLLAAALRVIGAGGYAVWTDEGWSIWAASDPTQVIGILAGDRHPPLYFGALSLWRMAAGDSHIALRLLSIGAGLMLVAVVYRIGADWFGRRAGLLAALLFAALPSAVYYAQEVRHYGWLALFSALAWLILLRYLRRPSRGLWIAYVLSITAMLYTLYFAAFTLAAQGVVVMLAASQIGFRRGTIYRAPTMRVLGAVVGAWVTAGVLYLPWLYVIVTQQAGILSSGISGFPGTIAAGDVLGALQAVLSTQWAIPLAAFGIGVWAIVRKPSLQRIGVLVGGGGLLVGMIALSPKFDFLAARTLVFVTPLLAVVCGYGLSRIDRIVEGRHVGLPLQVLIVGVWIVLVLAMPQIVQPRLDSDAAARALATAYEPGDAVILETGWDDNAFAYEIGQALPKNSEIIRTLPWTNDRTGGEPVVPQIEPILKSHTRVWVVQWLQAAQVLPYLQGGGDGYHAAQTLDVSAGAYGARFGAPTIQIRLFVRK